MQAEFSFYDFMVVSVPQSSKNIPGILIIDLGN